jgi:GTP cyclohydrolase I
MNLKIEDKNTLLDFDSEAKTEGDTRRYNQEGLHLQTPMKKGAFAMSEEEKMSVIEHKFGEIMDILGLDMTDDSLKDTPRRVAKMFVQEIFSGLNPANKPAISLFENKYEYRQMLVERDIKLHSFCEHHFLPIYGKAHVGYFANGKVIGLSKLNRIVEYYSKRPQVQERLTMQIAAELKRVLKTDDVAVYIDAKHMCVQSRGVEHEASSTVTSDFSGKFLNENVRREFLQTIKAG